MRYFLQSALENTKFFVNKDAPAMQDEALENLCRRYRETDARLEALSRLYPAHITRALLTADDVDADVMASEERMREWSSDLAAALTNTESEVSVEIAFNREHNSYYPRITETRHGSSDTTALSVDFFNSSDYQRIKAMAAELRGLIEDGAYVQRGERRLDVEDFPTALEWLISEARRGVDMQRYKGLGEMNPDQLWDTTMDPEVRRMLVVTVEDAIGADQMFTTLMGEQVEPRREFIQTNALSVVNLDI